MFCALLNNKWAGNQTCKVLIGGKLLLHQNDIGFLMLPGWIFWPDFFVYTNTIQVTVHSMNLVVISNFFLTYCFRVECFLVMLQGKRIMPSCQSVFRIPTMKAAGESFSRSPPGGFCVALKGSEAAVVGR